MKKQKTGIGADLRQRRKEKGLTLTGLAEQSGVSAAFLARVERGERYPSASVLREIAEPLGFSRIQLLIRAGYLEEEDIGYEQVRLRKEILAELDRFANSIKGKLWR